MRVALLLAAGLALGCASGASPCEPPGDQVVSARAAGCFVVSDGALLMVRTGDGWSIPGGFVEAGESSAAAAVRETREEAGVDVVAGPRRCAAVRRRFVAHDCSTAAERPAPQPDGVEAAAAEWMDAAAIRALPASALRFPEQRPAYLEALE